MCFVHVLATMVYNHAIPVSLLYVGSGVHVSFGCCSIKKLNQVKRANAAASIRTNQNKYWVVLTWFRKAMTNKLRAISRKYCRKRSNRSRPHSRLVGRNANRQQNICRLPISALDLFMRNKPIIAMVCHLCNKRCIGKFKDSSYFRSPSFHASSSLLWSIFLHII